MQQCPQRRVLNLALRGYWFDVAQAAELCVNETEGGALWAQKRFSPANRCPRRVVSRARPRQPHKKYAAHRCTPSGRDSQRVQRSLPMLDGQRVLLRPWCDDDLDFFGCLRNDIETQLMLLAEPKPSPPSKVRRWLEERSACADGAFFAVASKAEGRAVGFIEIRQIRTRDAWGQLGLCVDPSLRGQGIGAEALELIEAYARRVLMLRKIVLEVAGSNVGALRLYTKCGYITVGVHRQHFHVSGEWLDGVIMEKLLTAP